MMSRTSLAKQIETDANQLVNIKNNYREKDGITIFKILIERCGATARMGFQRPAIA